MPKKHRNINGHGGMRLGAGRPKGSLTRPRPPQSLATAARVKRPALALLDRIKEAELPLDRLLRRMCDPDLPEEYRDQLAAIALPYCHARIAPTAQPKRIKDLSDTEIAAHINALERGELLPPLLPGP
jgi:hypothetical protein